MRGRCAPPGLGQAGLDGHTLGVASHKPRGSQVLDDSGKAIFDRDALLYWKVKKDISFFGTRLF